MENKKRFLINSCLLYQKIIEQTDNNCLRRFLAFKIIVNAMSYEDIVNDCQFPDMREIRNIFLAHKQNNQFSKAFNSSELIKNKNIVALINFMRKHLVDQENIEYFEELTNEKKLTNFKNISKLLLQKFEEEFYSGVRISNNFLCTDEGQIKEVSSNDLSGAFYRYNTSKELSILANFFISNFQKYAHYPNALQNFKIDYILHAVNMKDCIFKDNHNSHSIDGLYEVLNSSGIGDTSSLLPLLTDTEFQDKYAEMRYIRNKLAGHMDKKEPLNDLLKLVDEFEIETAYNFVNKLDKAVFETANSHLAIQMHYRSFNMKMDNKDIVAVEGFKNSDYYSE